MGYEICNAGCEEYVMGQGLLSFLGERPSGEMCVLDGFFNEVRAAAMCFNGRIGSRKHH
jgi:hypothetical protein